MQSAGWKKKIRPTISQLVPSWNLQPGREPGDYPLEDPFSYQRGNSPKAKETKLEVSRTTEPITREAGSVFDRLGSQHSDELNLKLSVE